MSNMEFRRRCRRSPTAEGGTVPTFYRKVSLRYLRRVALSDQLEATVECGTPSGLCPRRGPTLCGACHQGPLEPPCRSPASKEGSREPTSADPGWPFLLTVARAGSH